MSTLIERLQYGFDRDSRRTWRRRALATGEDNAYAYDGLSQVTHAALGNLNQNGSAIGAVPAEAEAFDYDPTGNWRGYHVESDGGVTLDQYRIHDKGNRLTQISGDPHPVLLDRAGRMTQVSPDASGDWNDSQQIKWDAWGRITRVSRASDGAILGSYAYDGLTRRIKRTISTGTRHTYYSDQWQPLEERAGSESTAATQNYWGARHRDDLARRDHATTDGGAFDQVRYVLMDYFSPAAIIDEAGTVTERYRFSAFGQRTIMASDFSPRSVSECDFEFAFQGQLLDAENGFANYGYRYYAPLLGRWLSKDPIGEVGGINLYAYAINAPSNRTDFDGRSADEPVPAIDCSGYIPLFGSSCTVCYGLHSILDPYPYAAYNVCLGFAALYTGSDMQAAAACVAQCLIMSEGSCQSFPSCSLRNCCRTTAHLICYATCLFFPTLGPPPGGVELATLTFASCASGGLF